MVRDTKRNNLNENQLQILAMLYKFRYITVPLLTEYKALKSNSIQRTLDILIDKELVERKFDKSYIKAEKPALYYLSKTGIALLRTDDKYNKGVLNSYYRNGRASEAFVQHKLDTLKVFLAIKATYGDHFRVFTQQELMGFDDFPAKKPDLFLRARDDSTEYFVTLAHDTLPYLYRKRFKELVQHYDEEGWENGDYPTQLFIFFDNQQEYGFLSHVRQKLESDGLEEDELYVGGTTFRAITYKPYNAAVWTMAHEKGAPKRLV